VSRLRTAFIRNDTRATAAIETALVLPILLPLILGSFELGLIWWTNGVLQSVAGMTARCVAIGSTACANPTTYAVNLAQNWLGGTMITAKNMTVTVTTTCPNATGPFEVVKITASPWTNSIIYPFKAGTLTLTACFPT
jgi:Flp pilus assembly protein TadG